MKKINFLNRVIKEKKLRLVEPSEELKKSYINKSKSSLDSAKLLFDNLKMEESVFLNYYSMYHLLTALLYKVGIKCENHSIISTLSSLRIKALPSISFDENFSSNFSIADSSLEISGGWILNNITPGLLIAEYNIGFKKSESFVNKILFCFNAYKNKCEFFNPFEAYAMSMPSEERNFTNLNLTFSSAKILIDWDKSFTGHFFSSKMQGRFNMNSGQRRIIAQNFPYCLSIFKHFQNLPYHYSSAFKGQFPMTNFRVRNNILINHNGFHSHFHNNKLFKLLFKVFERGDINCIAR